MLTLLSVDKFLYTKQKRVKICNQSSAEACGLQNIILEEPQFFCFRMSPPLKKKREKPFVRELGLIRAQPS